MSIKLIDTSILKIFSFLLVVLVCFQGCSSDHNADDRDPGLTQPLRFSQVRAGWRDFLNPLPRPQKPQSFTLALRIPPWAVLVDDSGRPLLDKQGRPQITEPSGRTVTDLQPISSHWLVPDVHDPVPRRVLFQTRATK